MYRLLISVFIALARILRSMSPMPTRGLDELANREMEAFYLDLRETHDWSRGTDQYRR